MFKKIIAIILFYCIIPNIYAASNMKITFGGYTNITETLTNFPVLVVLSNNVGNSGLNFATHPFLSTNGWDLRFKTNLYDTGSATLKYEIDSWSTNLTATNYVWVQIPKLTGDGLTSIWATWGDSSDSNKLICVTNGTTWDTSYNGVWHLGDAGPTYVADSTIYTNRGTKSGGVSFGATGVINGAIGLDGVNGYINAGPVHAGTAAGGVTLSTWVYTSSVDFDGIVRAVIADNNGDPNTQNGFLLVVDDRSATPITNGLIDAYDTVTGQLRATKVSNIIGSTPAWYHIANSYNPATGESYIRVNGVTVATTVLTAGTGNYRPDTDTILAIGAFADGTSSFKGVMDEVRVSKIARSGYWSWAEYQSMASNTAFQTYGAATVGGVTPWTMYRPNLIFRKNLVIKKQNGGY